MSVLQWIVAGTITYASIHAGYLVYRDDWRDYVSAQKRAKTDEV